MDDSLIYVWTVFSSEPDGDQSTEFVCARKVVAEYLRDWLEAIEENRCFDLAKWYNKPGHPWIGGRTVYDIEESEVIL